MTERSSRPSSSGQAARKAGGLLGRSVRMVLAGHGPGDRPKPARPCLAILGRSNVGKSSLLNALLGVKVARVSQTPGRTQALYWYRVDDRFDVVDCPGYGYAKASKESRLLFSDMIEALLAGEPRPAGALLLVDGRLEPQESDRSMALFLHENAVPTVVAATKWDAVKASQRVRQLRTLSAEFGQALPARDTPSGRAEFRAPERTLQPVSSETGEHLPQLTRLLLALVPARAASGPATDHEGEREQPSAKEPHHAPSQGPRR